MDSVWNLVLLPLGLGLIGFVEPCSIRSSLLFVKHVDGRPAPLLRANGLFRAVRLTPGHHEVRFTYRPRMLAIGAGVSAAAAVGLLLTLLGVPQRLARRAAAG